MEQLSSQVAIQIILIFSLALPLDSITVNPALCPTNKIAPHRRIASWERPRGRTFAAYYDLLTPGSFHPSQPRPPYQPSLQEKPQADQPDDCGDIEDYDENDLSSVTPQKQSRTGRADQRWFLGLFGNRPAPQQLPAYQPPNVPQSSPQLPPHRPPYWSGGQFSNNYYKPPDEQNPSDNLKPVHETSDVSEVQQTYRPDAVGGPLSHVVGLTRPPTTATPDEKIRRRLEYIESLRRRSTQPTYTVTRRPVPRKLTNDNTVIGSFIDLLFK
ncbi:hypothetical protein ABMA28_001557 [Loxostege sticticalis]|uniref:Uncharacterized protein n=1 Tax=Loxostege sticticalis TaxID=481309 RepID=A0ABD0T4T8_LOXSC